MLLVGPSPAQPRVYLFGNITKERYIHLELQRYNEQKKTIVWCIRISVLFIHKEKVSWTVLRSNKTIMPCTLRG